MASVERNVEIGTQQNATTFEVEIVKRA
jgi:hypothetical protein